MTRVEDMWHKMMRFDASDEHIKELRCNLASIRQKVDTVIQFRLSRTSCKWPNYLRQ